MNKVGIITYHNSTNYGALLQCFALQEKIKELGGNCEVVDYRCKRIEQKEYITFPIFNLNLLKYLKNIKHYCDYIPKKKKMHEFIENNIQLSSRKYNCNNIKDSNRIYDKFIVGSDMVFSLNINGNDMTYFLDFADAKKRYSYAACIGNDGINANYLEKCKNELEKFQDISVRELEAKKYLNGIIKNDVTVCCDPTLLHNTAFWKEHEIKPIDVPKNKYILLYFLDEKGLALKTAKKISEETGMEIIVLGRLNEKVNNLKTIPNASVEEFLWYVDNSELVITSSYHGFLFSIIFNSNFMYCYRKGASGKLDNIAKITNSQDRHIKDDYVPKLKCDFQLINKEIEKIRKESIRYLSRIIEK